MTDYVTDFVQESEEQITELNNALLTLERSPDDDEAMERIFRIAHTLKGNCGAMGIEPASDLAHAIEDLLDAVRSGELDVSADVMDGIFDAVDELESMIGELAADGEIETDPSATIDALRSQLERRTEATTIERPTPAELDAVCARFEPPANPDHDAYLARLAITPHEEINYGELVVEALIDAFDLIGTDPSRREIEADDYGGSFDAVFATPVDEAAIASGLEPVEEVDEFEIVAVTDRLVAEDDSGDDISTDEANELEVDDLLAEFDEFDNLDERAEEFDDDDLDPFDDMGDAGSFDDLLGDVADEPESTPAESAETAATGTAEADANESVDDAGAVFDELKDEVEMVGFDELQDELAELEFDEFDDDEEVSMAELLGDDDADDSFLDDLEEESEDEVTVLEDDGGESGTEAETENSALESDEQRPETETDDRTAAAADEATDVPPEPETASSGAASEVSAPESDGEPLADETGAEDEAASDESDAVVAADVDERAVDESAVGDADSTPTETTDPADAVESAAVETRTVSEPADGDAVPLEDDIAEPEDEAETNVEFGSVDDSDAAENQTPADAERLEEPLDPSDLEKGEDAVAAESEATTDVDSSEALLDDTDVFVDEDEPTAADRLTGDGAETEPSSVEAGDGSEFDGSTGNETDSSTASAVSDPDPTDPSLDGVDAVAGDEESSEEPGDSSDDDDAADTGLETLGFDDDVDEFGTFGDDDLESVEFGDDDLDPADAFDHGVETDTDGFGAEAGSEPLDSSDVGSFETDDDGTTDDSSTKTLGFEDDSSDDFEATFGDPFADDGSAANLEIQFDGSLESEKREEDTGFGAAPDALGTDASSGGTAEVGVGSGEPIVDEPDLVVPEITVPDRSDRAPDADDRSDEIQSVRVDVEQIDSLLTLVEGLVTSRVRLRHAIDEGEERQAIAAELDDLEDLTTELQETVTNVRLVPLKTVTSRLPRVVRDIAREQDKDVSFEMVGESVELDRSILDRIGDPLIHLVRNAVDHGIESPDRREDADKPREGSVTVSAERTRDRVTITVADDGGGLDPDRLRSEAVEADVLTEAEANDLADDAAYDLVFHPGLSTADEVTDVSGRGVGMDVVSRTIDELDGTVTVGSDPGEGTTVTMTLPVSIAIDDVLFLESGGEEFGIPIKAVQDIEAADAVATDGGTVTGSDDEAYPLVSLSETLETPAAGANGDGMIVRIRDEVRPVALHCDHVHGQQEVVVTPFEGFMRDVPGVSGATVRGRGEVVTILDVPTL